MQRTHDMMFYQSNCDMDKTRLLIVLVAIESALLEVRIGTYQQVSRLLETTYGCNILDCYEHPEYLHDVFVKLDETTRDKVIKSIIKHTAEFSYMEPVSKFIQTISE